MDDIWHSDPWEIIGLALIKTSPGSIIIITTRLKDVAQSCCSSHGGRVYDMKPLDDDNSKRLFFKRIFDSEDKCPHELESASKDILKKCNGIPLAIISISSFLAAGVPQSPDHWNKVKESISSPLPGKNKPVETMKSVLSLSYFNLPHHLRTCLLYLSAFPEDCWIERDRLVCRWVAEGFVNPEQGESPYEAGLRYFNILINRSLIQPWSSYGVVQICRVHDVILNFLASKSLEENFLTLPDPSGLPLSSLHCKVRRLSLQNSNQENLWMKSIKPHVRSVACFVDCKELHPLTEFEVVRVLDLENCGSLTNIHLANIEMLLQLRYLSIRGTSVSELPTGIGQVQHLDTLDIRETKVGQLPSTIVLLEKLAHLFVGSGVMFPAEGISKMKGLEQLIRFSIRRQPLGFLKELGQLTNLRILQALWEGPGMEEENYYEGSEWGIFTSSLRALGSYKLHSLGFSMYYEIKIPIPMDSSTSSFPALPKLRALSIGPVSIIPIWMGSLANLQLHTDKLTPEDLRVLGDMPALETLGLNVGRYAGPFTIGSGAFQRLKSFRVYKLYQLMFMPGSMPNLKHLHFNLVYTTGSKIDLGIQHLASLTMVIMYVHAWRNKRGGVQGLEDKTQSFLDAHPNRPTLSFHSFSEQGGNNE